MNRVRLGIAILLVLVLISGGTVWYVHQQTTRLLAQLDVLEDAIDNARWKQRKSRLQNLSASGRKRRFC